MLWCPPSENTKQHKENKQDLASNVLDGVLQLNTFFFIHHTGDRPC